MADMDCIKMFNGHSAWFSRSVAASRKRLWKQHGGKVVDFDDAKFIFSEDSECDDTKRLYQSDAYLNEHLAIFHAGYINQCVREEDVAKVVLGKYFLPPTDVQKLTKMNWDWTKQSGVQTTSDETESEEESTSQTNSKKRKLSSCPVVTVNQTKGDTRKKPASQISIVTDNTIKKKLFCQTKTRVEPTREETPKQKRAAEVVMATGSSKNVSSGPCNRGVKKTHNPTVTKSVHIDVLPRMSGIVEDWIPGLNGCQVYLKT